MGTRTLWFVVGGISTIVILGVAAFVFIVSGGVPMQTSASPLPFERTVARMALHASYRSEAGKKNPLSTSENNMILGARLYLDNCAGCHGLPGVPTPSFTKGMFPPPPQFWAPRKSAHHALEGVTYWKITNGIRLSGMPGFIHVLSDEQRWQITMLLNNADKISPPVRAALVPAH